MIQVFEILEEGSIVIEAKYILEIVRKIDADEISLEVIDGSLTKISVTQLNLILMV